MRFNHLVRIFVSFFIFIPVSAVMSAVFLRFITSQRKSRLIQKSNIVLKLRISSDLSIIKSQISMRRSNYCQIILEQDESCMSKINFFSTFYALLLNRYLVESRIVPTFDKRSKTFNALSGLAAVAGLPGFARFLILPVCSKRFTLHCRFKKCQSAHVEVSLNKTPISLSAIRSALAITSSMHHQKRYSLTLSKLLSF